MSQSIFVSHQHLIFSTKNREASLRGIQQDLYPYLAVVFKDKDCHAVRIGGTDDHIHILVKESKNHAFSDTIGIIKSASSKWIKKKGDQFNNFAWQGGYACFAVGYSQIDQVISYIDKQVEHHKKLSFQNELRRFLVKHNQPFDERYIWD